MIDPRFAILGALVTLLGSGAYALDTVRGRTTPNRASWTMWALAPMVGFAAQLAQHAGLAALLTFAVGFGPVLVLLASVAAPGAYLRLSPFDVACGIGSMLALAAWAATGVGDEAIALSIASDFLAAVPTILKSHRQPDTESASAFIAGAIGSAITLLSIPARSFGVATAAFPAYIVADASLISGLILVGRRRRGVAAGGEGRA
ncbi:MAG TPA: hypothetical protein VKV27_05895 [Solirubrobacteraceae bacterium]|nr:hypothetical protein [Solirubrobacteraceae bacterium]